MRNWSELTGEEKAVAGFIVFLVVMVIYTLVAPFFTIWSLNELFHLGIEYSFRNYVAVVWLLLTLNAIKFSTKKE